MHVHVDVIAVTMVSTGYTLIYMHMYYRNAMSQLNEERSQKMVAEQLLNIVQSDFNDLRQKTIGETTSRLRLENEIGDIKVSKLDLFTN